MERKPLFSPSAIADIVSLRDEADLSISPYQAKVFDALKPYQDDPTKLFPEGVSQEIVVLLAVTAAASPEAWEKLQAQDERVPEILIERYLTGSSESELAEKYHRRKQRISQLGLGGLEALVKSLPAEKQENFPKSRLYIRRERGSEASQKSARRRWDTAPKDQRDDWLERIDSAAHSDLARKKLSRTTKLQWRNIRLQQRERALFAKIRRYIDVLQQEGNMTA